MKSLIVGFICFISLTYGKIDGAASDPEIRSGSHAHSPKYRANHGNVQKISNTRDTADTLSYNLDWNGQFIMGPGDAMLTVFQMPADGTIKSVNVPVFEWGTGDQQLTVSLHRMSYPYGADGTLYVMDAFDENGWIGGYDMDENGWVAIAGTTYTPGGTPGICSPGTFVAYNARDPFGDIDGACPPGLPTKGLLWPDGMTAATLDPANNPGGQDHWINTADYSGEPAFTAGTWIGVLVQFTGEGGGDDDATGFYYANGQGVVEPWASLKFYHGCTGTSNNGGWHIHHWVLNFELAVELSTCYLPNIFLQTVPVTTMSTAPQQVTAQIIGGVPSENSGIASASAFYQLDSLTAEVNEVPMSLISGTAADGIWEGYLPGQSPGTMVYWWIEAIDSSSGFAGSTVMMSYFIFNPTPDYDLIFNNQDRLYGTLAYSSWLYFYWGGEPFDIWDADYGEITTELVDNYTVIVEEAGNGPFFNTDSVLSAWYGPGKTILISGDEWLGLRYGWPGFDTPVAIPDGDFAKTVMGIETYCSDINFYSDGNQNGISRLLAEPGDAIVGGLADFLADSAVSLNYDPTYETGGANWLDGIDPAPGFTAAMSGFEGPLDSANAADPATATHTTMIWSGDHHTGGTAFLAFDAIALNTVPTYYWVGAHDYSGLMVSPLGLAYEYLVPYYNSTSGNDQSHLPERLVLNQNYPNPFNPVTTIKYDLPEATHVRLVIIDLLGREAAVLVDSYKPPGVRAIRFDAGSLASGMYFYRLTTDKKQITRKMVVLK